MRFLPTFVVAATSMLVSQVWASEVRIVSWNVAAQPMERVLARASDYRAMSDALAPDVLVLIELTGVISAELRPELCRYHSVWKSAFFRGYRSPLSSS